MVARMDGIIMSSRRRLQKGVWEESEHSLEQGAIRLGLDGFGPQQALASASIATKLHNQKQ